MGIEPTTSGLDLPSLCRMSYEVDNQMKTALMGWVLSDSYILIDTQCKFTKISWPRYPWSIYQVSIEVLITGGHFACACVNPLNDNSVGASNLMAGNRKLARKITVLLKAISLVLWIPYFPTKNIRHDKNRTFSTRVFTRRFFRSRFSWPFKDFQDSTPKSHVPVEVWFSLAKQCISMVWFPNSWFYLSGRKCIVAMFSCFKTKSETKNYHARFIY